MRDGRRGFAMVELVVVVVVIGILSTLAAAKLMDRGDVAAPAFTQQVRAMIRFAQKLAIAQHRPVFVSVSPSRVALCFNSECTARVVTPGGGNSDSTATRAACNDAAWYCEGVPGGVALAPAALIFFDQQGRPFSGTDAVGTDNSTFVTLTIGVNGTEASDDVIVEQETGYVH